MKMKLTPFRFKPFSNKQKKVLTWWMNGSPAENKDVIICDGAVRSGKTLPMSMSFVFWAMTDFNQQLFGMAGKTIGTFRRNVLFWLKIILRCRGYRVEDKRADNLVVISKNGKVNYFYIFGGKDERSQDLIQGITLAGMLFDEVTLMPESFVNQAVARCSVEGSKLWFNCNPEGPYHWFKLGWLDQLEIKNAIHLHFILDDNLSLSEKIKERYRRMFSGVFYKRFILGLWVIAEGVIYDMFEEARHIVECTLGEYDEYGVAVDYATASVMTFGLYGMKYDNSGNMEHKVWLIKEYYWNAKVKGKQKTDSEFADEFIQFLGDIVPRFIYVDPSAASFKLELQKRGFSQVRDANNDVVNGIRFVGTMFNTNRFFIDRSCKDTINETSSYAWDPKAQARGEDKPIKENDHSQDRNRYFLYTRLGKPNIGVVQVRM